MDTVSDALIRIKNGYLAFKNEVVLPYSKLSMAICAVLEKEGYISSVESQKDADKPNILKIKVSLKYGGDGALKGKKPAISEVKRISKPGLRIYKGKNALPFVLNGLGIALVSTPRGVMTDKQARKEGVGGEVLAYVW